MTPADKPSDHAIDENLLKREILYRARRSILEMDNIIGRFVQAELPNLTHPEQLELRDMLQEMDQNLLSSWRGEIPIPAEYQRIFALMKTFHNVA